MDTCGLSGMYTQNPELQARGLRVYCAYQENHGITTYYVAMAASSGKQKPALVVLQVHDLTHNQT